jgi:hypothetical protein
MARLTYWLTSLLALVFVAALVLCSPPASAGTIGAHLVTAHFGSAHSHQLESWTPGVYMRTDAGFTLGAYSNSHGAPSAYAAWTWQTDDRRYALTAGGVTGYPGATVMPLLVGSARVPLTPRAGLRVAILPKPRRGSGGLHLSIEHDF